MSPLITLLSLLWPIGVILSISDAVADPSGTFIDCGASKKTTVNGVTWIPDDDFIKVGNKETLSTPDLMPTLQTVRFFPDPSATKYCFELPVVRGARYLVRTTYFYGDFDGKGSPPIFDQIVDDTKWSVVDTAADFSRGLSTFYEIIIDATGKTLSVCLARNKQTVSSPFISALELVFLEKSLYNTTDFSKYALLTVARSAFGRSGDLISFPDDPFGRYWLPFTDNHAAITSQTNVSSSEFWNQPPVQAFQTALTTEQPTDSLEIQWPAASLPSSNYYIALYFQDSRTAQANHWRVFDVGVNGKKFYSSLNASTTGVVVYSNSWPLSGLTQIKLNPAPGSTAGPLINAGEMFQIRELGGRTATRDVISMREIASYLQNKPSDWIGDPCLPKGNSWTGVSCSEGKLARVVSLNLTNVGISGVLSPSIGKLTGLTSIWLGGNKLSGTIPDLQSLKELVSLHLENNQFNGEIPRSLAGIPNLHEVQLPVGSSGTILSPLNQRYLQYNNLTGKVPDNLLARKDLKLQLSPGNHFDVQP